MAEPWIDVPISGKLFENVDETVLTNATAALENAFHNETGGISRFPGLTDFCDLPNDVGRVYLHEWRGDLMAATSQGNLFRIDQNATALNVTGVPIAGGKRIIFGRTPDELLIAAGGPVVRFANRDAKTEIHAEAAPEGSHVGFIDSYVIVLEKNSGRFQHSNPGLYRVFDALDIFSADSKPDDVTALLVTPFRELLLCGPESIEQFERLASGTTPFFRRWSVGEGLYRPYLLAFANNATILVNKNKKVVRVSGQAGQSIGGDVNLSLEKIDDWSDAWMGGYPDRPLHIAGQEFVLMQLPNATNAYGTKGVTLLYDYRQQRWSNLYGWDSDLALPSRWPGWSHWPLWDKVFVGCAGKVCYLDRTTFANNGQPQRMLGRTAHLSELGEIRIDNLRARLKRGAGGNDTQATFSIRARRDNRKWSNWVRKGLGKAGEREMVIEFGGFGSGHTWQFEWYVTDNSAVELVKLQARQTPLGE